MAQARSIPVEKCVVPEVRITAVYDDELTELLADSLKTVGQIVPIVVVEHDETFYVCDGRHRLDEAIRRGDRTISAVVRKGDPVDVLTLNLVTNKTRGKTKASEMVKVISELFTTHELTIEDIVHRTGFSQQYIEKLISVGEAGPEVIEALDNEQIGVGVAFQLARLPARLQQAEVLAKQLLFHWSEKDMKHFVEEVLRAMEPTDRPGDPPPPQPPPPAPTCGVCSKEHELRHLKPVMCCPDCFGVAWRAAQAAADAAKAAAVAVSNDT